MSERELELLDELLQIADGSSATAIDVSGDGFSVRIRRRALRRADAKAEPERAARRAEGVQVRSPAVGIFSAEREWKVGDEIAAGALLGGVQSLGHISEITAPVGGAIRAVLTPSGAPVEYGQALFAIEGA